MKLFFRLFECNDNTDSGDFDVLKEMFDGSIDTIGQKHTVLQNEGLNNNWRATQRTDAVDN